MVKSALLALHTLYISFSRCRFGSAASNVRNMFSDVVSSM
jgi:hypothetical protein